MEKFIIDRIEGSFAVLENENGETKDIMLSLIKNAREGDAVLFCDGEYRVDREETERRKKSIEEKMKKLFGRE